MSPEIDRKKVLAFYYTWYGTPQVSGAWYHWPEGGHTPDEVDHRGLPDIGDSGESREV